MLCNKVTASVQRPPRDSCNYVSLWSDLGCVRSVSHQLWHGLLQLQRQIKYGCNFSLDGQITANAIMDCLLVRVNNRSSRTSAISNTADVIILSNVPVYIGPYRVAYVL